MNLLGKSMPNIIKKKLHGFVEAEEGLGHVFSALILRTHFYPHQWLLCPLVVY
jgi:hypothetical protein